MAAPKWCYQGYICFFMNHVVENSQKQVQGWEGVGLEGCPDHCQSIFVNCFQVWSPAYVFRKLGGQVRSKHRFCILSEREQMCGDQISIRSNAFDSVSAIVLSQLATCQAGIIMSLFRHHHQSSNGSAMRQLERVPPLLQAWENAVVLSILRQVTLRDWFFIKDSWARKASLNCYMCVC